MSGGLMLSTEATRSSVVRLRLHHRRPLPCRVSVSPFVDSRCCLPPLPATVLPKHQLITGHEHVVPNMRNGLRTGCPTENPGRLREQDHIRPFTSGRSQIRLPPEHEEHSCIGCSQPWPGAIAAPKTVCPGRWTPFPLPEALSRRTVEPQNGLLHADVERLARIMRSDFKLVVSIGDRPPRSTFHATFPSARSTASTDPALPAKKALLLLSATLSTPLPGLCTQSVFPVDTWTHSKVVADDGAVFGTRTWSSRR